MGIIQLPNQPDQPTNNTPSALREEQMFDGSVRMVHTLTQENGRSPFIAFMANGTFMIQDAYGSTIMTNPLGQMLIQPASGMVMKGYDVVVEDRETGIGYSLTDLFKPEDPA